jgi:hypothetical protein
MLAQVSEKMKAQDQALLELAKLVEIQTSTIANMTSATVELVKASQKIRKKLGLVDLGGDDEDSAHG